MDETGDDLGKNGKARHAADEPEAMDGTASESPSIGSWYETDEGEVFQVFATDEDTDAMAVRFLDGTVDTWVLSDWPGFEEVEAPDAWGTMDNYPAGRRKRGD